MLRGLLATTLNIGIKRPTFTLNCPQGLQQAVWLNYTRYRSEAAPIHVRAAGSYRVRVFRMGSYVVKEYTGDILKVAMELAVLRQLQHPSLVGFLFVADEGARLSVVMEWAGAGLREAFEGQGGCPEELAQHITYQLTSSLAHLHGQGIIHRDIKPDNIAVQPDFTAKLFDWGEALLLGRLRAMSDAQLARAAGIAGTPPFMPPEMLWRLAKGGGGCAAGGGGAGAGPCLRDLTCDKLDIWGLGTVLHLLLAGRDVLAADSGYSLQDMAELLSASGGVQLPPGTRASPAARDFLRLCLQRDPAQRPGAEQLLQHPWLAAAAAAAAAAAGAAAAQHALAAPDAGGSGSSSSGASAYGCFVAAGAHGAGKAAAGVALPFAAPISPLGAALGGYTIATAMYADSGSSMPSTPCSTATGATQ